MRYANFVITAAGSLIAVAFGLPGCASRCGSTIVPQPRSGSELAPESREPSRRGIELFPGVFVDRAERTVEFDAAVIADVSFAETPRVYLETLVCTPMTREHEALLITRVEATHIHAALLALGLEPGQPGRVEWDGSVVRTIPPTGPLIDVRFIVNDATNPGSPPRVYEPADWIVSTREPAPGAAPERPARQGATRAAGTDKSNAATPGSFVFAGSRTRTATVPGADGTTTRVQVYAAQAEGTVVGFATFSSELIAFVDGFSPDSNVRAPEWIVDTSRVPPLGTPVRVRLRPLVTSGATVNTPDGGPAAGTGR